MKTMKTATVLFAALGVFTVGAWAQHEEHHDPSAAAPATTAPSAEAAKPGMPGAEMKEKMAGMMSGKMAMDQAETNKLMEQVMASFAALNGDEKDRKALKKKLAEHGELLKHLQAKVNAQAAKEEMMHQHMQEMMGHKADGKVDAGAEHQH